jgi:chlorite dismutase
VSPSTGWGVLHLFCRVGGPSPGGGVDRARALEAVAAARAEGVQVVTLAVLGHKADLGVMALADDLWRLRALQTGLQAAGIDVVDSYVSMTELSEYSGGIPDAMKEARLHPSLPPEGKPAFCFYPMSKRRGDVGGSNWYSLPYDERKAFMYAHGAVGREFSGRILQVVTGSTGVDDWEWGVTLFGVHPDDLKECVYRMRFDEASARFGEFGPFITGMVAPLDAVLDAVPGGAAGAGAGSAATGGGG